MPLKTTRKGMTGRPSVPSLFSLPRSGLIFFHKLSGICHIVFRVRLRAIVLFHPNKTYRFNNALASFGIGSKDQVVLTPERVQSQYKRRAPSERKPSLTRRSPSLLTCPTYFLPAV